MDAVAETIEDFTDDVRNSVTSLFLRTAGPSFLRSAIAGVLTKAVVKLSNPRPGARHAENRAGSE